MRQVLWRQTSAPLQGGLRALGRSAGRGLRQAPTCARLRYRRGGPLFFAVGLILLLGGCFQRADEAVTAALPLDDNLPASWSPLGDVQAVNIDGDGPTEYLLFFTYGGNGGPVGAVIYNTETDEAIGNGASASSRLATSFIPYSLLPSYRPGTGQGFIAEPTQRNAIGVHPVRFQRAAAPTAEDGAAAGVVRPNDALAILGGTTYLTWVWWQPQQDSYGVTQLYAPGQFETTLFQPFNWESWRAAPAPIQEIIAVHPLHDRSLLCRRQRYLLSAPTTAFLATGAPLERIEYRAMDLGLHFCNGLPTAPFYPEAVVLAYLLSGEQTLWDQENLAAATIAQQEQLIARSAILRIDDLASYKTIPGTGERSALTENNSANGQNALATYTTVCAAILLPPSYADPNTPTVALSDVTQEANGQPLYSRRWLLFTLRHAPPQREPAMPDRLYLTNVQVLPVPTDGTAVDCRQRLEG